MKIGILTLQYGSNYGGVLQCYALQSYLKSLGHDVEVINYVPSFNASIGRRILNKLKTIKSFSDFLHNFKDLIKVNKNQRIDSESKNKFLRIFDDFRASHLNLTERVNQYDVNSVSKAYDAVFVGSDQVWTNLYSTPRVYFLDWITQSNIKKIAYAACSAHSFVRGSAQKDIASLLEQFSAIGVRDITTKELVLSASNSLTPQIVADPTLLVNFDEFQSEKPSKPYILTYILGTEIEGGNENAISLIKEKYGDLEIKAIVLPDSVSGIERIADDVVTNASPEEWVSLFREAAFIYTDSFHGIMFSIKFRKPFLAFYANAIRASRLIDLKTRFPQLPIVQAVPRRLNSSYSISLDSWVEESKQFINSALI